jgi:hypothetical protein
VLAQLAGLLAAGRLEIPIAKVYPLAEVRGAYRNLEQLHTRVRSYWRIKITDTVTEEAVGL